MADIEKLSQEGKRRFTELDIVKADQHKVSIKYNLLVGHSVLSYFKFIQAAFSHSTVSTAPKKRTTLGEFSDGDAFSLCANK